MLTAEEFELPSLDALLQTDVDQVTAKLTQQLFEKYPEMDLRRGLFHDVLLVAHAILETALRTNLQRYLDARSLRQVALDPSLASPGVVDAILSNWGVSRREGTKARGTIMIELSQARSTTIPAGFIFESNGYSFASAATYSARANAAQVTAVNDRVITQIDNGNYVFVIDVVAAEVGSAQKLNAGDILSPNSAIAGFVSSYALSSFEEGTTTETNAELLSSLQLGIAAKTLSNRTNMLALLRDTPEFALVTNNSIVGYGDREMLRDRHNIFGISYGGRVDWYCRGQQNLQRTRVLVEAVLTRNTPEGGIWQMMITRDISPGFFEIAAIRSRTAPLTAASFVLVDEVRGIDTTGEGFVPDVLNVVEGAYSSYQTAVVAFLDPDTAFNTPTGTSAEYSCEFKGVPLIAELQTFLSSRDVRHFGADVLVKAPVPCFVQITLTINKASDDAVPDITGITQAIVDCVNTTDFIGRLDGSKIVDVVHNFLSGNLSVTSLDLLGRIRRPDGTFLYLRNPEAIVVPTDPARLVTANTVQFFTEAVDVSINVKSTLPTAR